jgi:hypothetical protein
MTVIGLDVLMMARLLACVGFLFCVLTERRAGNV